MCVCVPDRNTKHKSRRFVICASLCSSRIASQQVRREFSIENEDLEESDMEREYLVERCCWSRLAVQDACQGAAAS